MPLLRTPAYVIYTRPEDMPHVPYVVREFAIVVLVELDEDERPTSTATTLQAGPLVGLVETLDEARACVPHRESCTRHGRRPGEPDSLVETWLAVQRDAADRSWPCMVCGDLRLFDEIAVAYRDPPARLAAHGLLPHINVAYCVDRPGCVAWATAPGPWEGKPSAGGV